MTHPVLRAQDDCLRGHLANLYQLLLCEQTAESEEERRLCLAGALRRVRWALDLVDDGQAAQSEPFAGALAPDAS